MKRVYSTLVSLFVLSAIGLQTTASAGWSSVPKPAPTAEARSLVNPVPVQYADKLAAYEEFVRTQMQKDKIPGMTIGFFKDDVSWVKGFGYADLENKIPARPESAYRLASITKTFTGAAIFQLVEKGKMSLDGEIQTYLPDYPKQKWPVTVQQLLAHLGGGQTGSGVGPEYLTPRQVVARIAQYPIKNEPGVKFDYQTSGYNLLGAAIEEVTGEPLGQYLRESVWTPAGMSNTQMDNAREIIPNRVRGYELINGEIQNARFIDVSSRFGGGGALGTVPDLLKWAKAVDAGSILSKASGDQMYAPVASKGGRYVGLGDGDWYYTSGWLVLPINGQMAIWADGGQLGTNTAIIRVPSQNLAIAFACNVQDVDRMTYIRRLYELITSEPMAIVAATRSKFDDALYKGLTDTFNYGSLDFERGRKPVSADPKDLAKAFAYFNRTVDRVALQSDYPATLKAINDGRHPVSDLPLIKVGSYMAMKLAGSYGPTRVRAYHTLGAPAFFDDYIKLYKTNKKFPKELRFKKPFELIIARWNLDWNRTWNEQTRRLAGASEAELMESSEQLQKTFTGAELYPDFLDTLLKVKQGPGSWKSVKLAVSLYPQSPRANLVWGLFLILLTGSDVDSNLVEKSGIVKEPPLTYLKKSLELDPEGFAGAINLRQIARGWMQAERTVPDAEKLLNVALQLHPQSGALYVGLGELYEKKGQTNEAIESYQKALTLDPNLPEAKEALKKLRP